jgi:major membrane immunogen (membrane-anchored lipoprotein)
MPRRLALALCAAVLLVACGGSEPRPAASAAGASVAPARLEACDDGGSGGVMIRGVCL